MEFDGSSGSGTGQGGTFLGVKFHSPFLFPGGERVKIFLEELAVTRVVNFTVYYAVIGE